MVEPIGWLHVFLSNYPSWQFLIIFFGVAFGGEFVLLTLAFLVAQNFIPIFPFVLFSYLGTLFSNTLWFYLGKTEFLTKIITHHYLDTSISIITSAVERISKGNIFSALAIIKFLVGTSFLLIFYTNKTGLRFSQYIYRELFIILIWLLVYIPIGYFSGLGFVYFAQIYNNLYAAIGFILLVIVSIVVFQIWLERKFR
ncbi:MAG: hypothetical protein WCP17_01125 [bacterium]